MATLRTQVPIETQYGRAVFVSFSGLRDSQEHIAILFGDLTKQGVPLVRVHSECLTGDVFASFHCDCGEQLSQSMHMLSQEGGILLYMRQEGRGIGLYNKLDAYDVQLTKNMDTYEANHFLGFPHDARDFSCAAQMLKALDTSQIKLLTNNPDKAKQLKDNNIDVLEICPLKISPNTHNESYLNAKKKAGHSC